MEDVVRAVHPFGYNEDGTLCSNTTSRSKPAGNQEDKTQEEQTIETAVKNSNENRKLTNSPLLAFDFDSDDTDSDSDADTNRALSTSIDSTESVNNYNNENMAYFAVYDGHGGRETVDFLKYALEEAILQEITLMQKSDGTKNSTKHLNENQENMFLHANRRHGETSAASKEANSKIKIRKSCQTFEECLTTAYLATDCASYVCKGIRHSGSTAVSCLLYRDPITQNRTVYTANCGDARAVLYTIASSDQQESLQSNNMKSPSSTSSLVSIDSQSHRTNRNNARNKHCVTSSKRLSQDHKATDPDEILRIERIGGFVLRKRVLGILAVSRSFGDHGLKAFIPALPHTSAHRVNTGDFLVVACDGVWDVMSDENVGTYLCALLQRGVKVSDMAKRIVNRSKCCGSTDNISCIVVKI
eukprot:g1661.t1